MLLRVAYLLALVAVALAWVFARRRAEHHPIAALLTVGLVADVSASLVTPRGVTRKRVR
jgi:hypothetical protein